ncbi:hypothetical protein J1770_gp48 [Gordonia phage EMoore]|uniref:Uncharacterized protein n=1 Tax=Gordonia phage EMoore TaxID=2656534 RepID=A0A649VUG2_9CAUD|nr:hypothetical protein J1770_gp48 [Gordonia phage EMoore]QGJ95834.1 hypothetical protein SEA_EMOORE_48 [Gordonia phage EMoore]
MADDEIKGQKVTNANGTDPGTDGSMVKFRFSGSPTSLYELSPEAGDVFVMTCTVQCTNGTHRKLGADGTFLEASFAVRECVVGRQTTLREPATQTATDDDDIVKESKQNEAQLTLVPPDEADAAAAEQAAVNKVADPFKVKTDDGSGPPQ